MLRMDDSHVLALTCPHTQGWLDAFIDGGGSPMKWTFHQPAEFIAARLDDLPCIPMFRRLVSGCGRPIAAKR
jgi:hypothetical protein